MWRDSPDSLSRKIDTHVHIWTRVPGRYLWVPPGSPLDEDFVYDDVEPEAIEAGIGSVILVQADDTVDDAEGMARAWQANPRVAGIVTWAPLSGRAETERYLDTFVTPDALIGIRRLPRHSPWDLSDAAVVSSLAVAAAHGLPVSLANGGPSRLVGIREALSAVPDLRVILDHAGCPSSADALRWREWIAELATTDQVVVKFTPAAAAHGLDLRDMWDIVLESFGPKRVMLGTDWPVSSQGYASLVATLASLVESLSTSEQDAVWCATPRSTYGASR